MKIAVFRPDDERLRSSVALLRERGFNVLEDPLLEPSATGEEPLPADYVVFTSVSGVRIAIDSDAELSGRVCAIGPRTREALEERGVDVYLVPDEYTSEGLVKALEGEVGGMRVEVARSDHGSPELLAGLNDAGAFVHETVLYELQRPVEGGVETVEALLSGELDGVFFTSSLTVEYLLDAAEDTGNNDDVLEALRGVVVGVIGEPTLRTAEDYGVDVDFVPPKQTFRSLVGGLEDYLEQ